MPIQKRTSSKGQFVQSNDIIEPAIDQQFLADAESNQVLLNASIESALKNDIFESKVSLGEKQKYDGSPYQIKTYENLEKSDPLYALYISRNYGSYRNFLFAFQLMEDQSPVFDPRYDKKAEVTVITKDKFYKSDHISPIEAIMEALSGVCTVDYLKKDGRPEKLVGTLKKELIGSNEATERFNFFSPLPGNRIVLYNLVKQSWSSFYMANLLKFTRDDTIGIE